MNFEEAIKLNNLGNRIQEQYGQWGHFVEENAKTVIKIVDHEVGRVWRGAASSRVMAMCCFTWLNESTFSFNPEPNTNKRNGSPWNWDVGPFQLNVGWAHRMSWQSDFKTNDLPWKEVFGQTFYAEDGTTPVPFNGNVVTHGRCALRRLLHDQRQPGPIGFADRETMRVVLYTGPKAQQHRLRSWNEYGKHFEEFFEAYTSE